MPRLHQTRRRGAELLRRNCEVHMFGRGTVTNRKGLGRRQMPDEQNRRTPEAHELDGFEFGALEFARFEPDTLEQAVRRRIRFARSVRPFRARKVESKNKK